VKETGDLEKEKGGKKDKNSRSEFTRILPGFFFGEGRGRRKANRIMRKQNEAHESITFGVASANNIDNDKHETMHINLLDRNRVKDNLASIK